MKLWSKIFPKNETSTLADPADWLRYLLGGTRSSAGVSVNETSIIGLSVVFACASILSRTFATLPGHLFQQQGRSKVKMPGHSVAEVLAGKPNEEMTSVDFFKAMQHNLTIHGNAYAQIITDNAGRVQGLWPILPGKIRCVRRDDGTLVYELFDTLKTLSPGEVFHVRGNTNDGLCGIDPTFYLRDVFGLAIALDINASKFFANGSRPGSTLEHPGKLSETARENILKSFEQRYQGSENSHKLMILEEGLKFAIARQSNEESQFDETRSRQAVEICRIFGVPPHKVAILDKATYSNIEEQQIDWVQDGLLPICVAWEKAINCWLLSERDRRAGLYWKFDLRGIMRGRMSERAEYYSKMVTLGALSPNEVRELEDMNPVDGLDVYLQALNTTPIAGDDAEALREREASEPMPTNRIQSMNGNHS